MKKSPVQLIKSPWKNKDILWKWDLLIHISQAEKRQFQKKVLQRYAENKRDLPWRKTTDPYKILVSEVMSQQTQIPRVIPKFERWMNLWPTVIDVALAERTDILRERSGLGFNRRAINVHEACKRIVYDAYVMMFPQKSEVCIEGIVDMGSWEINDYDALHHSSQSEDVCRLSEQERKQLLVQVRENMVDYMYLSSLPWVWEYTAYAILAFGYNQEVPVIDINIKRVLLHSFQLPEETTQYALKELALSLIPRGQSCEWHNALMDYGSEVLHSRVTGVRSTKQSTFVWSDREVRGWILKQLLGNTWKSTWNVEEVERGVKNYLTINEIQSQFPQKDVVKIVEKFAQEWMIKYEIWLSGEDGIVHL